MSLAVQSVNQLPVLTMGTYTTAATYLGDNALHQFSSTTDA